MKNKTKLLCVVLMFTLLISILAACGGDTQPSATPSGTTPTAKPTPTDTTPSETTPGEDVGVKFPLIEETATLSVWRPWFNMLVTDANDLVCNQLIEQKTNVHIEWILAPVFSMAQDFGLMMSTGDYPDILQDYGLYAGGFDAAVNEGVYMDAADYLSLTPTFNAFREDDNIRKLTTTDSGVVYFGGIQSGEQPAWGGPMMRIDWLETVDGCNRWMESGTGEWVMPYVTLTTEESATYSRYFNDIQTYVDEFSTQVINGLKELNDTTWNEYVNWLRSSGIEECIKVYQEGLDRYLAR